MLGGMIGPKAPPDADHMADFGNFIATETEKWGKVIGATNIKPK